MKQETKLKIFVLIFTIALASLHIIIILCNPPITEQNCTVDYIKGQTDVINMIFSNINDHGYLAIHYPVYNKATNTTSNQVIYLTPSLTK